MHLYGLIIGIAITIGINYFEKKQTVIPKNKLFLFELGTIVSAIIGARAYHVIEQWPFYSQNLHLIPQTWNGGLGIFGAIIGGIIFMFIFLYSSIENYKLKILNLFDSITPILPLSQAVGRLGNYVNQENPIWWFEAILNLILFFTMRLEVLKSYRPTSLYLIGYGVIRFITEFWRNDTWIYQNIKVGQVIALTLVIVGITIIRKQPTHSN